MNNITIVDFSHLCMRMLFVSITETKPKEKNGLYVTEYFQSYFKHLVFNSLQNIKNSLNGEMVIAMDGRGSWRKDIYEDYKGQRGKVRDESKVNFDDYYKLVQNITDIMIEAFPFKVIQINKAEADDIAGVISERYSNDMNITLVSSDKDWFQVLAENPRVKVYDPMKRIYIELDEFDKEIIDTHWGEISRYTLRHSLKGDTGDNIKKINKDTEFTSIFLSYLKENNVNITEVKEFLEYKEKDTLIDEFKVYKKTTAGKNKGKYSDVKDIYKDIKLMSVDKKIQDRDSLKDYIDSHELYEDRLKLNLNLVDFNRIPDYIKEDIIKEFNNVKVSYNPDKMKDYFLSEGLNELYYKINNFYDSRFEIVYTGLDDFEF